MKHLGKLWDRQRSWTLNPGRLELWGDAIASYWEALEGYPAHPGEATREKKGCWVGPPSPPGGASGPWAPSLSFRFSCSGGKSRLTGQEEAPGGGGGTEAAALPVGNLSASSRHGAFPAAPKDAALTPASPGR